MVELWRGSLTVAMELPTKRRMGRKKEFDESLRVPLAAGTTARMDAVLIEQSLATQYGILPAAQAELPYPEWAKLVGGLMDNTPLGRVVAVRGETDRKKLAAMGPWAQRIHQQWQAHLARRALETTPPAALRRQMDSLEAALLGK